MAKNTVSVASGVCTRKTQGILRIRSKGREDQYKMTKEKKTLRFKQQEFRSN